jgi:putative tricarboxylic transport membrane protein
MLASISSKSPVKNLIGGLIGLFVATIGVHLTTGISRFTFNIDELFEGVSFVPVLIGLFAMSEIFVQASKSELLLERIKFSAIKLPSITEFKNCGKTILRSTGIGTFIGILPAEGGTVSAMIGYNEARRWSKNKDNFGKGEIEGVAAPEAANNSATGGAMIPTLALGIPGSATTAVILGGFQIHGLRAGPYLFEQQPDLLYTIFYGMLLANFIFLVFGLLGAKIFSRISLIPRGFLWPSVFVFCLVGSYGLSQSMVDVYIMLISGVVGFFLRRAGFSPAPIIMGIVLGQLVENSLAQSIIIFDQNLFMFFTRPIAMTFFILTFLSLFYKPIKNLLTERKST